MSAKETKSLQKKSWDNRVKMIKKKCSKCERTFETKSGSSGNDWCPKCHGIN